VFFEKSENIFSGIFQAAQAAKRRAWGGNPNKIPIGQNERLAKFGTVVESCSKKVAVSSVWAFADTPACPAWILPTMRRYFSLYYLLRTARQIWQSSPEFLFVFS